jgi:hybrid cluster-associated redox disulfide protein
MSERIPQPYHGVNDIMQRWPETTWLFMHHGMACAGCPVGAFHTVEEAALEYRIPLRVFLSELRAAVADGFQCPQPSRSRAIGRAAAASGHGAKRSQTCAAGRKDR